MTSSRKPLKEGVGDIRGLSTSKYEDLHVLKDIQDMEFKASDDNESIQLVDKKAEMLLEPQEMCRQEIILMVLSIPRNSRLRDQIRSQVQEFPNMRAVFLHNTGTEEEQSLLVEESERHGDILQGSLPEGYKMTTYKVMLGLHWASSKCDRTTRFIVKMDDNSHLDMGHLVSVLKEVEEAGESSNKIFCPYEMRGLPVWRHIQAPIMGKWAVSESVWPEQTYEDHCNGWLWITTPKVARGLVAAAKVLPKAVPNEFSIQDDTLITGYLRSHLPAVEVQSLDRGFLWNKVFSHYSFFGFLGNVFLNDFVLEKRAGNSGLDYINSPKFAICVLLEVIVFDYLRPAGIATEWDTSYWCHR